MRYAVKPVACNFLINEDFSRTRITTILITWKKIIMASLSEPHIDEFAINFLYIYIYVCMSISVICRAVSHFRCPKILGTPLNLCNGMAGRKVWHIRMSGPVKSSIKWRREEQSDSICGSTMDSASTSDKPDASTATDNNHPDRWCLK